MNRAYAELRDGLPERSLGGAGSFPSEPKQVRAWVEALPRADQGATLSRVAQALDDLNHQRMEGGARFAVLELLRPVVLDGLALLERQLQGASFPLPAAKARVAEQVQDLHAGLELGYRSAVVETCAPAGSASFLRRGQVAQSLERALYHGGRRLALAYLLYGTPPEGTWLALHQVDAMARELRLADKVVEDIALQRPAAPATIYAQSVLLAVSNPYRFSQREQFDLWPLTRDLAEHCSIDAGGEGPLRFAVARDRDQGPGFIPEERVDAEDALLWLDLRELAGQLDDALGDQRAGEVMLRFGRGRTVVAPAELLRRLRAGWGHASERHHSRLGAGHHLDTVIGLSGLHYYLSGRRDFDAFMRRGRVGLAGDENRATWAHAAEGSRIPVARAEVLDQSLGGYRLAWDASQQVRARVGELVGLSVTGDEDDRDWMIGVVRWLRYTPDGAVSAGIELLARRAMAVGLRAVERHGAPKPALRAVQFEPVRQASNGDEAGTLRFLVPGVMHADVSRIEVTRLVEGEAPDVEDVEVSRFGEVALVENAGDYLLLSAAGEEA